MKKGFVFTLDAVLALMIFASVIPVILLLSQENTSGTINQKLLLQAEDSINSLADLKIADVINEPVMQDLYRSGVITDNMENRTLMEFINELWASNSTTNNTYARNITEKIFTNIFPPNVKWSLVVENDTLYNTSSGYARAVTVSKRLASGFKKGAPSAGFSASVFLNNIAGKTGSSYYFFGGFVGEGNITVAMYDIPDDAQLRNIYMELNMGSNFTLYINDTACGIFNRTGSSVQNFTINSSACLNSITPGASNNFTLIFSENEIVKHYIGGGYIRVNYVTSQLAAQYENSTRFYMPGIKGIVSYFDSVYVPGNVTNISIYLHYQNNYSTIMLVGNATVYNNTGNESIQTVMLTDQVLKSMLNYSQLGAKNVPIRFGVNTSNLTLTLMGTNHADVILITDVSGSMDWNFTCISTSSCLDGVNVNNCADPNLTNPRTRRISVARCLDKDFASVILNSGGNNRVGLVSFSDSANSYLNLTTDQTLINTTVNAYTASGGTCVACAINRAYLILQNQSTPDRQKFIIVMTDGVTNVRATNSCYDIFGDGALHSLAPRGAGYSGYEWIRNSTGGWIAGPTGTSTQINDVDYLNATHGFAVGNSGLIMRWNGTGWSNVSSPVASDISNVDIFNETYALAVGASGRVLKWNGSVWTNVATIANSPTLNSVSVIQNQAFIAGVRAGNGRVYNSTNEGVTWNEVRNAGNNFRGIKIINSSRAFAVGDNGRIDRWDAPSTWTNVASSTGEDLYAIESSNSTNVVAVGGDDGSSVVVTYTGGSWTLAYDSGSDQLRDVIVFDNYTYAVGEDATIVEFNGTKWNQTFNVPIAIRGNLTAGISCTNDSDLCTDPNSFAALNAEYSSCRAFQDIVNMTVHSVGFGPISSCGFAKITLQKVATCGNGTFYSSSNASELKDIYANLAQNIVSQTFLNQALNISSFNGLAFSTLYPDSYIQINYSQPPPSLTYQEITVAQESQKFNACNYTFFIPGQVRVIDPRVTSFSGDLWTSNVTINSTKTANATRAIFSLSTYGKIFNDLGDPFVIYLPDSLIATNGTTKLNVSLGSSAANTSSACSVDSRFIYKSGIQASVSFGGTFPQLSGGVFRVYHDVDFNGVADGYTDVVVGSNLPNFDPTVKTIDQLDPSNNALHDAILRLLEQLNFISGSGLPGSQTNPIDIKLADVEITSTGTSDVPFAWGPVDVQFEVGI